MLKNELSVIIEVIPLLIAERIQNGKIDVFDLDLEKFISFEFKRSRVNESIIRQTIDFCIKTGIMNLFQEVKDIHDYLLGVEVGMDTNARKNRSGDIFEKRKDSRYSDFYNVPGSKPIYFLWVTDGPAWHKMKEPLLRTMEKIDWLLNYRIIYKLPNT